jgi:hypothetical protein
MWMRTGRFLEPWIIHPALTVLPSSGTQAFAHAITIEDLEGHLVPMEA